MGNIVWKRMLGGGCKFHMSLNATACFTHFTRRSNLCNPLDCSPPVSRRITPRVYFSKIPDDREGLSGEGAPNELSACGPCRKRRESVSLTVNSKRQASLDGLAKIHANLIIGQLPRFLN